MKTLTLSALALVLSMGLAGCSQDDSEGVNIDKAADNAGDIANDAGDAIGEAAENSKEAVKQTYNDATTDK